MRLFQDRPHMLEIAYSATLRLLGPFRGRLKPGGKMERLFVIGESPFKRVLFGCRMCGDCVLHSTGMTCPMTCPKNLRNGPCGGVRLDGNCEVVPEMPCVWVLAWERSKRMPAMGDQIRNLVHPLDRRLQGTSAWINELSDEVVKAPEAWSE